MHAGSYFTYIMASRSHTLYIGVTGDLRKRVFQHKWKRSKKITLIESVNSTWVDLSRNWYEYQPADYRRALDRMDS